MQTYDCQEEFLKPSFRECDCGDLYSISIFQQESECHYFPSFLHYNLSNHLNKSVTMSITWSFNQSSSGVLLFLDET